MKKSGFFAMLFRMKYINRWGLMKNLVTENLKEHSFDVAVIAHCLGVFANRRGDLSIDPNRLSTLALYHDAGEIITGDLPTPIKYNNEQLKTAYKKLEKQADERLLSLLPAELTEDFRKVFHPSEEEELFLKAADKLSALIKCMEEELAGNREFIKAKKAQLSAIRALNLPEAELFVEVMLPAFSLTLDELEE